MKPALNIDPQSPFGKFTKSMRALLAVPKSELATAIKKHESKTKKRRSAVAQPNRRKVNG
ncbi:MAG: hypothetical protein A3F68_11165 [Acidobacteria bacterium RIFCSPLOWO2_12_FULL_54_10]|nr:MAG: hypothetical protein A3F68_11165 [Acidobacteria bacterium RIFCSPLOWO2_12_FULL_54_10]